MIGAIAGDIIGSRFEGHPGPLLFHPRCRFTDDSLLARHSGPRSSAIGTSPPTLACMCAGIRGGAMVNRRRSAPHSQPPA